MNKFSDYEYTYSPCVEKEACTERPMHPSIEKEACTERPIYAYHRLNLN